MARLKTELHQYDGQYTFSNDEIIEDFNITYQNDYDTVYITITLQMVSGDYYTVDLPIQSPSNLQGYG
jgi:hypothetical protein